MEQIEDKIEDDRILNNAAYRRFIPQLIKDHEREWIVISKGELIGIFASRQEAIRAIKTHNLLQQCNLVSPIKTYDKFTSIS
jgi:urocanate hydratase